MKYNQLTKEKFIEKAKQVHNSFYDYSLTDYKNNRTKVKIICPKHGEFEQRPDHHMTGHGCKICINEYNKIKYSKSKEQFVIDANNKHNNYYSYNKFNYVNWKTKSYITCPKHGDFLQDPNTHLDGCGCPKCSYIFSKGEKQIEKWLIDHNIKYIRQYTYVNCKNIKPLPFDFFILDFNMCIEFDGEQHYEPCKYFGGFKKFLKTNKNDSIKTNYCLDNGVKLIRIPYWEFNKIDEIMANMISI